MNQDSLAQGEQAPLVPFELKQDAFGVWVLELTDGSVHSPVVVVRAFPVSHPLTGFSVLNRQGHELVWVDDIQTIGEAQRHALLHAVGEREFMPEIERLERVSGFIAPRPKPAAPAKAAARCKCAKVFSVCSKPAPIAAARARSFPTLAALATATAKSRPTKRWK